MVEHKEVNDAKIRTEDDRIYNYFKEHPGILLSVISAFSVILTFIFNTLIYMRTAKYLEYWGIDSQNVNIEGTNQIYSLAVVSVFFVSTMFFQQGLTISYEKYLVDGIGIHYINYINKKNGKRLQKLKRQLEKTERSSGDNEKYMELQGFIEESKEIKKGFRGAKKLLKKRFCPVIVMWFVLRILFTFTLVSLSNYTIDNGKIIMFVILMTFFEHIFTYFILYLGNIKPKMKKLKKEKLDAEKSLEKIQYYKSNINEFSLYDIIFNMELKKVFNNNGIITFVVFFMMLIMYLCVIVMPLDKEQTEDKKIFSVVQQDNETYVMIYKNTSCFYLEKAIINQKEIIIDTTKQRILESKDVSFENMQFEKVIKKDLEEK